jgi:hypothetical protein
MLQTIRPRSARWAGQPLTCPTANRPACGLRLRQRKGRRRGPATPFAGGSAYPISTHRRSRLCNYDRLSAARKATVNLGARSLLSWARMHSRKTLPPDHCATRSNAGPNNCGEIARKESGQANDTRHRKGTTKEQRQKPSCDKD